METYKKIIPKKINKNLIIKKNDTIKSAINKINKNGNNGLFVINDSLKLIGVLTDSDIRKSKLLNLKTQSKVNSIMQNKPFFINEKKIQINNILNHIYTKLLIPVVDDKKYLKGYFHILDFIEQNKYKLNKPSKKLKKILLIGGAGYAGSEITNFLLKKGFYVRVFDKLIYQNCYIKHKSKNFDFYYGSTLDIKRLDVVLKDIDCVLHLAEIVGDPASSLNSDITVQNNYISTENVAKTCIKNKIKKLIYFSSCSVYGHNTKLVNEKSNLNPLSLYASCKIASESALKDFSKYNNINIVIFRLATLHGYSQRQRFDLVVNKLVIESIYNKKIFITGGKQWRPFLSLKDLSNVTLHFINYNLKSNYEIFNIGSNQENYRIIDISKHIKEELPKTKVVISISEEDNRDYKVDFRKLKRAINFKLSHNIRSTITQMINSCKKDRFKDFTNKQYSNYLSLGDFGND